MGIHNITALTPSRQDAYAQVVMSIATLGSLPQPAPRDAHITLLAQLLAGRPNIISYVADADDLEERAEHIERVLDAVAKYITAVMRDTDSSAPGGIGSARLDYLLGGLEDLKGDAAGLCERAADELRENF